MQLILLAAGKGSRLPIKIRNKPKCLIKILGKTLLEHNIDFYKKFKNRTIVTGYKRKELIPFINKNKFKNFYNKDFNKTNMVHSLFKVNRIMSNDIVVCYGDIIFDKNIFINISKNHKNSTILLNKNWLKVWKGRMEYKNIKKDAENIEIYKNNLISIGTKIINKMPKYQFMGIINLKKKDFFNLKKFYNKIKNKKIDFTSFLNQSIKANIVKINILTTTKYWFEIDTIKDVKFTEQKLW
jgi:choline kinase